MFDIFLRHLKDNVIDPAVKAITFFKVSPNWITLLSGILGKLLGDF